MNFSEAWKKVNLLLDNSVKRELKYGPILELFTVKDVLRLEKDIMAYEIINWPVMKVAPVINDCGSEFHLSCLSSQQKFLPHINKCGYQHIYGEIFIFLDFS